MVVLWELINKVNQGGRPCCDGKVSCTQVSYVYNVRIAHRDINLYRNGKGTILGLGRTALWGLHRKS